MRVFVRHAIRWGLTATLLGGVSAIAIAIAGGAGRVMAQPQAEPIRIGYLLSKAGGFNTGDRAGASMGADEVNLQAQVMGKRFEIVFATGGRSSEVVAEAERLIDRHGVQALMGSVSGAATLALAELAERRGLVFFNIGSDVDSLRGEKCSANAFSIGPSLTMRVRALGQWALVEKEWPRWAVIVGESLTERRLAAAAQTYLAANGGAVAGQIAITETEAHAPAPILQRLRAIDADFVFVALEGERQQLILEAYRGAGMERPIGGALPDPVRFGRATSSMAGYWSAGWSHLHDIYGASELNNRFVDWAGMPMSERAWGAWAGVKILGEAVLRAGSVAPADLRGYFAERLEFDGYMGRAMNFRPWNQQLRESMMILRVNQATPWNGWDSLELESLVPLRGLKGWRGNPLDSVGFTAEESGCRLP